MSKFKKLAMFFSFIFVFCISAVLSGCGIGLRLYESEYFIYTVGYDSNDAGILGLTDKGREQEYLVIPETIDGNKVTNIHYSEIATKKLKKDTETQKTRGFEAIV